MSTARRAARAARSIVSEAPAQLPRLQRIEQLDPSTRISLGLLLDEQARRNRDEICFLFGDRAHRQGDVKHRVDSVVKGLISVGVHQGDRVGVLMDTRPSAFTVDRRDQPARRDRGAASPRCRPRPRGEARR